MQWSPDPTGGFTLAEEPWLPVGKDHGVRNVLTQLPDPDSHLNLYRRLLALRRSSEALRTGSYLSVDPVPPECFVFERSQGSERVLVAVNFSAQPLSIDTHHANEGNEIAGALHLLPYEAVVVV
jgi:glycosidase